MYLLYVIKKISIFSNYCIITWRIKIIGKIQKNDLGIFPFCRTGLVPTGRQDFFPVRLCNNPPLHAAQPAIVDGRSGRQDCPWGKHPGGKHPGGKHPGGKHREIKGAFESAEHLLEFQQHVDAFGYISSQKENISQGLAMPAAYDR